MLNRQHRPQAHLLTYRQHSRVGASTAPVSIRNSLRSFAKAAHHAVLATGIMAIGTLGLMYLQPEVADQLKSLSPYAAAADRVELVEPAQEQAAVPPDAEPVQLVASSGASDVPQASLKQALATAVTPTRDEEAAALAGNSHQQQRVTTWLSKRYRVASDATNMLVSAAYLTAREMKVDPLLILSVIAIESRFNPFAESPVGAQGLMQVMSKVHREKFEDHGGVQAALNPVANIRVGTSILKEYVRRGGSVEAGLKLYVGAGAMETDQGYGAKVLAEYAKLKDVAMGKKVPVIATSASAAPQKRQQDDKAAAAVNTESASSEKGRRDADTEKVAAL